MPGNPKTTQRNSAALLSPQLQHCQLQRFAKPPRLGKEGGAGDEQDAGVHPEAHSTDDGDDTPAARPQAAKLAALRHPSPAVDGALMRQAVSAGYLTSTFDLLPDSALIREAQLVRSSKRPHAPGLLPFSSPTLWRKVKAGTFPRPKKLSAGISAWRVGDVRAWLCAQS